MTPTLDQMRAFLRVLELRSFRKAAEALALSQPALTVRVSNLEAALGAKLLDRDSRRVAPTAIGLELAAPMRRALAEAEALTAQAREAAAGETGRVTIAALPSFAAGVLPGVIVAFRAERPRAAVTLRDAIAGQAIGLVAREEADLGLVGGPIAQTGLETLHRGVDRLQAVFPRDHELARAERIDLAALARHPLVLLDPLTSVRAVVDAAFRAAGATLIPACETTYMSSAAAMARAGLGVAILPAAAVEGRRDPDLSARPIDDPRFERPIALIKRAGRSLAPAAAAFAARLIQALEADGGLTAPELGPGPA